MKPWKDPSRYAGPKRYRCLGCGNPCTNHHWGKWCMPCNVDRMTRINKAMAGAARSIGDETTALKLEND